MSKAVLCQILPVGLAFVSIAAHAAGIPWLSRDASTDRTDPRDLAFTAFAPASSPDAVSWANPLDGGAIRAVFVVPRFTLGDVRNLSAQLELELGIVAFWNSSLLGRPEDARPVSGTGTEETLDSLHRQLARKLDVITIANVDLTQIPEEDFARIIERVHEGAGLVLTHHRKTTAPHLQSFYDALEPEDGGSVVRGVGHQIAPEWTNGLGFVETGRYGQGRVVELDFPGPRPETHCLIPALTQGLQAEWEHYDTYLSLAARAIRWAAHREPKTSIVRVEPEPLPTPNVTEVPVGLDLEVEGDALDLIRSQLIRPFIVHLEAPSPKGYSIRTRVRRPGVGTPVITDPRILREGDSETRVYLVGGSGIYYIDVWILRRDDVVDWYTEAVLVDAWPVINSLTLNRTALNAQDTLGLSFTMPARGRPASVRVRATDPFGRVVAKSFIPVAPNTSLVLAGLDMEDLIAGPVKVEVFAVDRESKSFSEWDPTHAAYAYRFVPVRTTGAERRLEIVTPVPGSAEYNARNAYQTLRQNGIARAYTEATLESVGFLAEAGLVPIASIAQYTPDRILDGAVREPCFTDSDWLRVEMGRLQSAADMARQAGASRLSLGNGNCLTEGDEPVCQSASAVDAYAQYLRKIYSASGTTSLSARQSSPVDQQAYDRWIDFRSFMDAVFASFHADARAQLRQIDHRPQTGFVLRPQADAFTGYDLYQLAAAQDWLTLPDEPLTVEKVRSYTARDFVAGLSIPDVLDERDSARDRWYPWYAALHDIRELWLPPVLSGGGEVFSSPLIAPDGTRASQAADLFDEARAVSSGFARVIHEGRRENSGIAVYDSRASYYLNHSEPSFGCDSPMSELRFIELVRRLGYQFDFVSPHAIVNGALAEYKVLLMPMVRAMSDAEVNAVRAFHASGGCLIADLTPGAYDEHGVPRTTPPLDELFGVRHSASQAAGAPADALVQIDVLGARTSGSFSGLLPDMGVENDDATVGGIAGTSPVWLISESAGLTALTNHPLPDAGESATASASLLDALLDAGGAMKPAIVDGEGEIRFRGEVFNYELDGNSLVAILADPGVPKQHLRIAFTEGDSVYDALQARRVSRPKKHTTTLDGGGVAVFGVLPYAVSDITVETLPSVVAGTRLPFTLGVNVRKAEPSTHVVHVELVSLQSDATGPIPHYSRDIVCRDGQGEGFIRLALNERSGVYKLTARDVLTGMKTETVVKVLEP
jgi:hypothetical protein